MHAKMESLSKSVLFAICVLCSLSCQALSAAVKEKAGTVQVSSLAFTSNLYSLLRRDKSGEDFFFSPFSISSAIAMLRVGAKGATEQQIREGLGLPGTLEETNRAYQALMGKLKLADAGDNVTLDMANKLFADATNFEINQDFNATLTQYYQAGIERLDFRESEKSRNYINNWVEQKTRDRIQDLLPAGSINEATKMVIANAIYFKGDWAQRFDKTATKRANFTVTELQTIEVDMMRITDEIAYADTPEAYVVDVPYQGEKVVMTLIVPKQVNGLSEIENKMSEDSLRNYLFGIPRTVRRIQLMMPRFKIESGFGLKKFLSEMGMKDMFDPGRADLSGIPATNYSLFVDEGFHKAFVEVNEEGTEAAASTVITLIPLSAILSYDPPTIKVDRPSLIAIRHKEIAEPLFFGRLSAPGLHEQKPVRSPPQQPTPDIPVTISSGMANGGPVETPQLTENQPNVEKSQSSNQVPTNDIDVPKQNEVTNNGNQEVKNTVGPIKKVDNIISPEILKELLQGLPPNVPVENRPQQLKFPSASRPSRSTPSIRWFHY